MSKVKITDEQVEAVATLVAEGCDIEVACAAAEVSQYVFMGLYEQGYLEKQRIDLGGKAGTAYQKRLMSLYNRIAKARADFISGLVRTVSQADDWKASAWLLERTAPSFYSKESAKLAVESKAVAEVER